MSELIPLETETQWGTIKMVGCLSGERYYWIIDKKYGGIAMLPADVVEPSLEKEEKSFKAKEKA